MASETLKRKLGIASKKIVKPKEKHAPKRAKSSYFLFCDDERPKVKAVSEPGTRMSEISKICSKRWKDLSPAERQRYVNMANIEKETFNENLPAHLVKLPAGWKRQTDACSKLSYYVHLPTKVCQWTRPKASDTPSPTVTQPRNAYALFGVYMRQQVPAGTKVSPKTISEQWKVASSELKSEFEAKANADKERYARDRTVYLKTGIVPSLATVNAPSAEMPSALAETEQTAVDTAVVVPETVIAAAREQVAAEQVAAEQVAAEQVAAEQVAVVPETVIAAAPETAAPEPMVATAPETAAPEPMVATAPETATAVASEQAPVLMEVTELPSEPVAAGECDSDDADAPPSMDMPSIP
jgi:hypothetical protein